MSIDPGKQPSEAAETSGGSGRLAWVRRAVVVENTPLSIAFWGAVLLEALAFLLCKYPPMIDYPQHVAMGGVMGRLLTGSSGERALYNVDLFTYNAGIESFIALLSVATGAELAGRLLLAAHVVLFALGVLALCDVSGRPRWYALLFVPLIYNYVCGWGFANFVMATPFVLIGAASWLRVVDGDRRWWILTLATAAPMLVGFTHVLAMLCLCVVIAVVSLARLLSRGDDSAWSRIRSLVVPALVMLPGVGWCASAWFHARATSTTVWEHQWAEGQDDPLWHKLRYLFFNATGNFINNWDQHLLIAAVVVGVLIWYYTDRAQFDPRMRLLALAFAAAYAIVPKVFIATFHIYARFLVFGLVFAIAALPVLKDKSSRWLAWAAAAVALITSGHVMVRFQTIPEVDDLMAVIDDMPADRKLIPVTWEPTPTGYYREIWVHAFALYQARKPGLLAYSFTRNESPPLHFKPGLEPPHPPGGFEWNGGLYDPHAAFAKYYDLVLVRSWLDKQGGIVDPRAYVFKDLSPYVKPISRHGRFFLYDTAALKTTPTPLPVDPDTN